MTSAAVRRGQAAYARANVVLRRVELGVSRSATGRIAGSHLGTGAASEGTEPDLAREYQPGVDDVRYMDWAVTARTLRPHVRARVPERDLTTLVLVDGSASMTFGTRTWTKRELAAAAVAGIATLTDRPGNRIGVCLSGSTAEPMRWPPRQGRRATLDLIARLLSTPPPAPPRRGRHGPSPAVDQSLTAGVEAALRQAKHRGLFVVISDFLDPDLDGWSRALRRAAVRHDVVAIEVTDPREHELSDIGVVHVTDPETGRGLTVDTGDSRFREQYRHLANQQRAAVRAAVRAAGVRRLLQLRTDEDWLAGLARLTLWTGTRS